MIKLLFFHFWVTNSKLKKKISLRFTNSMVKLLFFHFWVTNSKLKNKKFHFDLLIRKMKKQDLNFELWSPEISLLKWNKQFRIIIKLVKVTEEKSVTVSQTKNDGILPCIVLVKWNTVELNVFDADVFVKCRSWVLVYKFFYKNKP